MHHCPAAGESSVGPYPTGRNWHFASFQIKLMKKKKQNKKTKWLRTASKDVTFQSQRIERLQSKYICCQQARLHLIIFLLNSLLKEKLCFRSAPGLVAMVTVLRVGQERWRQKMQLCVMRQTKLLETFFSVRRPHSQTGPVGQLLFVCFYSLLLFRCFTID